MAAVSTYESIQVSKKKKKKKELCLRYLQGGKILFIWLGLRHFNCVVFSLFLLLGAKAPFPLLGSL